MSAPAAELVHQHRWTESQQAALQVRARTLVAAAAGSGKTSVLSEIVVQALVARELSPAQVCAVTFTEKAAQEMRSRIAEGLERHGERELLAELELARIGTIHSLCAVILHEHGAAVGVDPGAAVFDQAQAAWLVREAASHATMRLADDADVHWLRARMGDDRICATLLGLHRCAAQPDGVARLVAPDEVQPPLDTASGEHLLSPAEARRAVTALQRLAGAFDERIEQRRHELGRLSFDDLERLAVQAVRLPAVRTALRGRWTMVLVDEFQDTNERQYELLDAIGGDRLFMVGDEWQSIYRFRGADVDVFRARRAGDAAEAPVPVLPMRENFRSSAGVLDVVNHVFSHERVFGAAYEPVVPGTAELLAATQTAVELLVVPDDDLPGQLVTDGCAGREREAARVAERIAQLVASGAAEPGEIAVLYARGTGMDLYEDAIRAWGIPVLRAASGGYYDQRDVRDALAVLALVRNRRDEMAALSVLAGPLGRLGWHELDAVTRLARERSCSLLEAASDGHVAPAARVAVLVEQLAELAAAGALVELVARVVALPELELGAALEHDGVVRVANLRRLVELAASAEHVGIDGVAGFLEFTAAQRQDARVGEASVADETIGAVRMLTIHAAKGLEFPYVFVVEAAQSRSGRPGLVPEPRVDADGVVHVALPRVDGRCERTPPHVALEEVEAAAASEEALRLWYVATTRAKRHLVISGRWRFEATSTGKPRSVPGALSWLQDALDAGDDFGGPDRVSHLLDERVLLDTRPARELPRRVWDQAGEHCVLASPLQLPAVVAHEPAAAEEPPEPHALRAALRDAVTAAGSEEWRQLDGTRIHDAVARLLDAVRTGVEFDGLLDPQQGPWLTEPVRARLHPIVAAPVFRALASGRARTEVPYVAGSGAVTTSRAVPGVEVASSSEDVDAGRIDALALLPDGSWWVVDWKTTLDPAASAAWREHGSQLARYARAGLAAGAPSVLLTLVPLDRPDEPLSWRITPDTLAAALAGAEPARAEPPLVTA